MHYTAAAVVIKDELLRGRHVLAVAGTHGKTTTTSLLAWILESAGLNPSFLIGGIAENFGSSFRLTDSDYFVHRGRRVRHGVLRQGAQDVALPARHGHRQQHRVRPRRHLPRRGGVPLRLCALHQPGAAQRDADRGLGLAHRPRAGAQGASRPWSRSRTATIRWRTREHPHVDGARRELRRAGHALHRRCTTARCGATCRRR